MLAGLQHCVLSTFFIGCHIAGMKTLADLLPYNNLVDVLISDRTRRRQRRPLKMIDEIIIHHSGTVTGSAESFARYHVLEKGMIAIGYHMVKDDAGIHMTLPLEEQGAHCRGHNKTTVGITCVGNWDIQRPSNKVYYDYICMVLIIDMILSEELGYKVEVPVGYHKDYRPTSCPGQYFDRVVFERELAEFRQLVS